MIYDKYQLIAAYIDAKMTDHWHEDFKRDATAYLEALEKAFNIRVDTKDLKTSGAIGMLFNTTCKVYVGLREVRAGYMDDSLINVQLEQLGDIGEGLQRQEQAVNDLLLATKTATLTLLHRQFDVLWPIEVPERTSRDLLSFGFDDSKRPNMSDYMDLW